MKSVLSKIIVLVAIIAAVSCGNSEKKISENNTPTINKNRTSTNITKNTIKNKTNTYIYIYVYIDIYIYIYE